jgi:lycopene beta-cyclase
MQRYDYIIAGAGASGLSLAYHLNQAGLTDKRILLIDKAPKTDSDRTWCFWEKDDNPFDGVVFRKWRRVAFHGHHFSRVLDLAPYTYKMIRGIDFYSFMSQWLREQPNIVQRFGLVSGIHEDIDGAMVHVDDKPYCAQWVFNSIRFKPQQKLLNHHYLLQHFLGWVIHTPDARFDPQAATLMDFRIDQQGETRFCYVLPFDEHTALVEFTVFSSTLLPPEEYKRELESYISDILHIERYEDQHEEFGVIPMTDAPFPKLLSPHVVNIGTAGGSTKPSTGYTFQRIQKQSRQMAIALRETDKPFYITPTRQARFALYDSVLLNILDQNRYPGKNVFTDLFQRNPAPLILKFLDEETTPAEDLRVLASVNLLPFTSAAVAVMFSRAKQSLNRT